MFNKRILIPLLLIMLLASMVAFGTNVPLGPYFDDNYFDLSDSALILKVIPHEKGGLEADVSAYNGLVKISGGSTSAVTDNSATWNTALQDITGESIGDLSNVDLTNLADNKILKYNSVTSKFECEDDTGGGATTFLGLTDTPANYTGQAGLYAKVNAGETALEFGTPAGGGTVTTSGTPEVNDIARFTGATVIEGLTYAEFKAALDLEIGTDIQAYDAALTSMAGLTYASPSFIKLTAEDTYAVRTLVEVKTDLDLIKCRNNATAAPTVNDDEDLGYAVNSVWTDVTNDKSYVCVDATADNAIWLEITYDLANDTTPELGGELDAGANSIGFTLQSTTGDGTTTIDWTLGNKFKFTFGAQNETFTFTAPTNPCTLMLTIIQDATGSRTITWPATVKWPGGVAPTLTTTAGARDKIALDWDGTQYDGCASLDFK